MPAGLPRTRKALVAPMLPLPTVRMSMPLARADEKAGRNRAEQIRRHRDDDVTQNWHARVYESKVQS